MLTLRPIAGAKVSLEPFGQRAFTTHRGHFRILTPPGRYTLYVEVRDYVSLRLINLEISGDRRDLGRIELVPLKIPAEQEARLYERVVKQTQSELPPPEILKQQEPTRPTPTPDIGLPPVEVAPPIEAPIPQDLPATIDVRWPDGRIESIPLEHYLKGVVPGEVPANWPEEALKAQAVAARSYTVAYTRALGPICTTTSCQIYNPNLRQATTDAAVDATAGVVATYDAKVIWSFYFSRCNSSHTLDSERAIDWRTCQEAPWNYLPYCRSRPCGGHAPYGNSCGFFGHGVGLCQWGAWARAKNGLAYGQIIDSYYTNVQLKVPGGPPGAPVAIRLHSLLIGPPLTLRWSGTADQFNVELWNHTGSFLTSSDWINGNQWTVSGLPAATYHWRVRGRNGAGEGEISKIETLEIQPIANRVFLPSISSSDRGTGW